MEKTKLKINQSLQSLRCVAKSIAVLIEDEAVTGDEVYALITTLTDQLEHNVESAFNINDQK